MGANERLSLLCLQNEIKWSEADLILVLQKHLPQVTPDCRNKLGNDSKEMLKVNLV